MSQTILYARLFSALADTDSRLHAAKAAAADPVQLVRQIEHERETILESLLQAYRQEAT